MASRNRKYFIRYGGEKIGSGTSFGVPYDQLCPTHIGEHSCSDEVHPGPPYSSGGPLYVTKKKVYMHRTPSFSATFGSDSYSGKMAVLPYVPSPEPTPLSLSGWGAKGWNRTYPLHPVYNLGVSLAELKDFPRMITQTWKTGKALLSPYPFKGGKLKTLGQFISDIKKGPKFLADNYLNVQFGWVPFAQDIEAVLNYQEKLRKKLIWLQRHNGKSVRRKIELDSWSFSEAIARTVPPQTCMVPGLRTEFYAGSVVANENVDVIKEYSNRIWYVAKYKYWLPELANDQFLLRDHSRLKGELYGLALDPTIIYKVMPWSWLLDWFSSAGAVVQNAFAGARFGVVAEYAYVMCRETFTYTSPGHCTVNTGTYGFLTPPPRFDWSGTPKKLGGVSRTVYEFRQREVANPYGFGITFGSLSNYQWSILAALGLTRGGKHFAPRA